MKKMIIFYERQYLEFIKNSMAFEVEVIKEFCISCVQDVEEIFADKSIKVSKEVYIGFAIDERIIKGKLLKLLASWNTNENRVLDIYKTYMAGYSKNRYQRIMNRKLGLKLDGLILGISHGMTGIIEEKMPGNACNLCYSSQDIYFNYLTLKKCFEEYYHEIKEISYVVIDMFDYFYFNFDTILTGAYERFFEGSGFLCEERVPWNKSLSVEEINNKFDSMWKEGKSIQEQELFMELFPFARQRDNGVYKNYPIYDCLLSERDVLTYKRNPLLAAPQCKAFEHTIGFQIKNMEKLLLMLQRINPQIKIFTVLLPKYIEVEKAEINVNKVWKDFFMKIIGELKSKFEFEFFDFKEHEDISGHMDYYRDLTHLNHKGAAVFSEHLANRIKDI